MRFKLPKEEFVRIINSISMDLPTPMQAPNMQQFNEYCRGVAGVPGNLSLRIFGVTDEALIEKLSTTLGNALQITNILRDVKEDANAGRLYIPKEMLEEAGITSTDPLSVVVHPNLARAREQLAKIAAADYETSYQLIKQLDKKTARPILMMANIYKRYFDIMQNRGWEVISPKPYISKMKKFSLALRAFFSGK